MSWAASTATAASSGGSESCPPSWTRCEAAPALSSIARNNTDLFDVCRECEEEWQRSWVGCAGGARSAPFFRVKEPSRGQNIKCSSDCLYMHYINYITAELLWKRVFWVLNYAVYDQENYLIFTVSIRRGQVILFRVSTHLHLATRCVSGIRNTLSFIHCRVLLLECYSEK